VCCATGTSFGALTTYTDLSCASSCTSTNGTTPRHQLCDPAGGPSCPNSGMCSTTTTIFGFDSCR
jgi:hypothetical protein